MSQTTKFSHFNLTRKKIVSVKLLEGFSHAKFGWNQINTQAAKRFLTSPNFKKVPIYVISGHSKFYRETLKKVRSFTIGFANKMASQMPSIWRHSNLVLWLNSNVFLTEIFFTKFPMQQLILLFQGEVDIRIPSS